MTDLLKLAERVEKGRQLGKEVWEALGKPDDGIAIHKAVAGSFDSADALREAVLPEWVLHIEQYPNLKEYVVTLTRDFKDFKEWQRWQKSDRRDRARGQAKAVTVAYVSAILRAKHEEGI